METKQKIETSAFFADMENVFPNHCLYRIDHHHPNDKGETPAYVLKKWLGDVSKYNNAKTKQDIYFTPNWEFAISHLTPGSWYGRRRKPDAKRMFAFVLDEDSGREFWKDFELEPSIVIKTLHWYHAYWLLETPIEDIALRDKIEWYLCDLMDADQKAKDAARIYRLPWAVYWKDNKWNYTTEIVKYEPSIKYDVGLFTNMFEAEEEIMEVKKVEKKQYKDSYALVDTINQLDIWDVIHALDSRREIKWNVVREDWARTGWYKYYRSVNWINNFTDGKEYRPKWPPFACAKQYFWNSASKAFKFFREELWVWEIYKQEVQKDVEIAEDGSKLVTVSTPAWDIVFDEKECTVSVVVKNEEKLLVDAYIYSRGFYRKWSIKVFIVWYKTIWWDEGELNMHSLWKSSALETVLSEVGITFFGTKNQKLFLISEISKSKKEYKYMDKLWIYGKDLIINTAGKYIIEDKRIFVDIPGLKAHNTTSALELWGDVTKLEVDTVLKSFMWSHSDAMTATIFLSMGMSLFTYYIRETFWFFPLTILIGITKTGKTTLRRNAMNIFGMSLYQEVSASVTKFAALKKTQHYLPFCVWEYLLKDLLFDWDPFMKNNYDSTDDSRWTQNQELVSYEANSSIIIDWENKTANNAVYTRSFVLFARERDRIQLPTGLKNINKYFIDRYDNIYDIKKHYYIERQKIDEHFSTDGWSLDRMADNYWLLLAFAQCFWLYDQLKSHIYDQARIQLSMEWDDNINKIIKTVFMLAVSEKMVARIDSKSNTLNVDFIMNTVRYQTDKIDAIKNDIQLVNNHFNTIDPDVSDILSIPLDYIFKTKGVHILANTLFNSIYKRHNEIPWHISSSLAVFAEANGFKNTIYYNEIAAADTAFLQNNHAKDVERDRW